MLEAGLICNVVHHTTTVSATVEGSTQRLESLLACRVPYLEHANFTITKFNFTVGKVSADGRLEMR